MAKITIAGDAMVITSSMTLEEIKKLEKYSPKSLVLKEKEDGKEVEVFRVGSTDGCGVINQYGASFGSASHDEKALATITMGIPKDTEDARSYAAEKVGAALMNLNQIEEGSALALKIVDEKRNLILENITVA